MPILWRKLKETISAKLNAILNASASPEEKLNLVDEKFREQIGYMQSGLTEMKTGLNLAIVKRDNIVNDLKKNDDHVMVALNNNREDLARELLARKAPIQASVDNLNTRITDLDSRVKTMETNRDRLVVQYNQFQAQKAEMVGRFRAAKAETGAYGMITGIGTKMDEIKGDMTHAMDETDELEARASALRDMTGFGTVFDTGYTDSVTKQVEELKQSAQVDAELAKFKAKIAGKPK